MRDWYTAIAEEVAAEAKQRKFIPSTCFKIVRYWATTPTADLVVVRQVEDPVALGEREFLLTRRTEDPWKGNFFIPGGRIFPGLHPDEAAKQNCKRELGFVPDRVQFMGFVPCFNPCQNDGDPTPYFTLCFIYVALLGSGVEISLNAENKEPTWFKSIQDSFPEPVKQALRMAGFSEAAK